LTQFAFWQSPATEQRLPSAHFFVGAQLPPQSTSVSVPFLVLSLQLDVWQTLVVQTKLAQSAPAEQLLPLAQPEHIVPPQSMSLSLPFLMVSLQVGVWQIPPVQTPLVQSPATVQCSPLPHFFVGAHPPPQSASVSVPFFTPSLHDAPEQLPLVQTRLTQSLPDEQP